MKILRYILLIIGLISVETHAETNVLDIIETSYYECEILGTEAMAIQSIRHEQDSSIQEFMATFAIMTENELGSQPLLLSRINAVAKWVYYYYPAHFDPVLIGQTYAGECKTKTFGQIKLLFENSMDYQTENAWENFQH